MIRKVEMERFTVISSKLFDDVVAALKAAIGHPKIRVGCLFGLLRISRVAVRADINC